MMTSLTGVQKRRANSFIALLLSMCFRDQKGLTLVEVLVSILILASGCVYVLQALAKSAEVQKRVETSMSMYPLLASKLAQIEARIPNQKNIFKDTTGSYTEGARLYRWSVATAFLNPLEAKAPRESLGQNVLLQKTISLAGADQKAGEGLRLATLFRAAIPENQK